MNESELLAEMVKYINGWERTASFLRIVHIVLAITGVCAPLTVAVFNDKLRVRWIRALSLVGAAAIGIYAAFDIGVQAGKFRDAWKILHVEKLKYDAGQSSITNLITAYQQGETIIGRVKDNPFALQGNEKRRE